ncbi:transcription factor VOZ1-like [Panicum miliaceum]|uniref:Transcription factor VOZ1-like n=1 Tax=Panicum miliaceum TaxID=4540 RepID=A0A3L6TGV8_PANMI|nr:transcription factor VOZ1-like [Panicum miliaceum]
MEVVRLLMIRHSFLLLLLLPVLGAAGTLLQTYIVQLHPHEGGSEAVSAAGSRLGWHRSFLERLVLTGRGGAAQNSQENNREASDPPSETLRLLQLVPTFHQNQGQGNEQEVQMPNLNQQCEVVAGRAAPSQQSLDLGVQGDCGEVAVVANAMFNEQARPLEHYMLNAICIQHDDAYAGLKFFCVCQQVSFWVAQWLDNSSNL